MSASKIFLYFCLSFVSGIFISSILGLLPGSKVYFLLPGLIFGLILISVFWKYKKIAVFSFCLLLLIFGIWHHQKSEEKLVNSKMQAYNDSGQIISLVGVVSKEPDLGKNSTKLTIDSERLVINGERINVSGRVLVTAGRYPEYKYGDKLEIAGVQKNPSGDINGFNYKNYLLKDGIYSVMDWPKIELVGKNQGNIFYKYLFSFKNKLKESVNGVMSPPQSALLEALFFGDEENISQEWKDKFNFVGVRHITAVSGMNITIISALILNFLLLIGFWRSQAFYLSVVLIVFYILMIGAPASAVRAGVMGLLFLTAQHFGRLSAASRAIIFASAFMLLLNPLLLKFDVGFQLSFLATMGLVYLQPVFSNFFKKIPNIFQLRYALSATLAAQIFTLPILIFNFGRISVISPLANVLIVPFLSIITITGFIFSFVGIISQTLAQIISWPAWFLLTYIIKAIDLLSKIPFASINVAGISWILLAGFYICLAVIVSRLRERLIRPKFLG
jgi:competence protein ComEC